MPFDMLTTTAVRRELLEQIVPGRVQRVVQPSEHSLGLEIYAGSRTNLILSADPQNPYVVLQEEKPRRGTTVPSPLEEMLRKYVRGARLVSIEQPDMERILTLRFEGPEGSVALVCEMMGRLANVILVDAEGLVQDSLHRVPPSINRVRTILPRKPYVPPPPQGKLNPLHLESAILTAALASSERDLLWQKLVDVVGGLSPLAAREIAFRTEAAGLATASPADDFAVRIIAAVQAVWAESTSGTSASVAANAQYAPYLLTHLEPMEHIGNISTAILRARAARGQADAYGEARSRVRALLTDQIGRLTGKLESLEASLVPEAEVERLQHQGNAILGMAYQIHPGQTELVVDGLLFGEQENEWHIPLDASLSASDNAQKIFARYHKHRDAAAQVPRLIDDTKDEMAFMAQLDADLTLASDRNQIDQVEQSLVDNGYLRPGKKRPRPSRQEPPRLRAPDGTPIILGRNSQENDMVTFHMASPADIWLHAHGIPGSHVIIRSGNPVSDDALLYAAELAAFYSSGQGTGRLQVDFCDKRHVKRMPGGRPGMVIYTHEQTLVVEPQDHLNEEE